MIHPRPQDTLPRSLETLQDAHPAWSIWQSNEGHCYATRLTTGLTREQAQAGMSMTVEANNPERLAELLGEQADAEQAVTA